ncbi:hypothetical protein GCM10010918_14380 [Paenibacillus radicis (ex Gao et al. 2016)]|uniref:Uncharacterized protein n=2 Tax=Paenibacillus radicis (ex Gao et al. 2016) TaxID=1737354 RepID=A0A917LWM4_9BACL|nr:hypothetical protein [Paenibacillus radicis (ex Gao et al. 2016)]GGG61900.1 hypothetical protein GCM10010918_14380 [Paenibacillus radicis (ex Gao et al. 2016)]
MGSIAKGKAIRENQVYSNRVVRSEFDRHWSTRISQSGYVIYTAKANRAKVVVLLANGQSKLIAFPNFVGGGGTSHYSKPHFVKNV